jgi:thiamine pyrophosphate-dependent acetolactate synthase large subunit-like protein
MMGISAFWSPARYGIPLIAVVCNNRSYFNDEVHQEKVARMRGRPVENKGVGQEIREPDIDFAAMARAQGMEAIGPVNSGAEMVAALRKAVALYRESASVLIDVRVEPAYAEAMSKGMTEDGG